ncbi:hypothetical protein N8956_00650 [bacterium]|jgi:hypothetical protein|nr:hypothetical protein [bacterium]MDB4335802.1 hypothetical protein [bacterium]|tara:strand:+ start:152 stop:613 length:462 start_codon:yes stop_codon:yes gene_type:complete
MADKKITQLTDLGDGLASVDLFHIVDDPSGTPINKKITAEDVFNNIPTWIGLNSTSQAITGDGSTSTAIEITNPVTEVNATSAAAPVTLADGANGQVKTIINVSTSGTSAITITPSNLRGGTTVTLNAPGETATLMFKNSNWNVIGGYGFVVA